MTGRTVAQKMGIKPGWRAHLVDVPDGVLDALGLPPLDVDARARPGSSTTCTCS